MIQLGARSFNALPPITWGKLPSDFLLPDEPVKSNLRSLLADALREPLELAGLILESMLIASNFGICATVDEKMVVKASDGCTYHPVQPIPANEIWRSYTPYAEGDAPTIVMEFILSTEGGEYSINPYYPYGKRRVIVWRWCLMFGSAQKTQGQTKGCTVQHLLVSQRLASCKVHSRWN